MVNPSGSSLRVGWGCSLQCFRSPAHTFLTVRDARHAAEAQECPAVTDQAAPSALELSSYLFSSKKLFLPFHLNFDCRIRRCAEHSYGV